MEQTAHHHMPPTTHSGTHSPQAGGRLEKKVPQTMSIEDTLAYLQNVEGVEDEEDDIEPVTDDSDAPVQFEEEDEAAGMGLAFIEEGARKKKVLRGGRKVAPHAVPSIFEVEQQAHDAMGSPVHAALGQSPKPPKSLTDLIADGTFGLGPVAALPGPQGEGCEGHDEDEVLSVSKLGGSSKKEADNLERLKDSTTRMIAYFDINALVLNDLPDPEPRQYQLTRLVNAVQKIGQSHLAQELTDAFANALTAHSISIGNMHSLKDEVLHKFVSKLFSGDSVPPPKYEMALALRHAHNFAKQRTFDKAWNVLWPFCNDQEVIMFSVPNAKVRAIRNLKTLEVEGASAISGSLYAILATSIHQANQTESAAVVTDIIDGFLDFVKTRDDKWQKDDAVGVFETTLKEAVNVFRCVGTAFNDQAMPYVVGKKEMLKVFTPSARTVAWANVLEQMRGAYSKDKLQDYWKVELAESKWAAEFRQVVDALHPTVQLEKVAGAYTTTVERFAVWTDQLRDGAARFVAGRCVAAASEVTTHLKEWPASEVESCPLGAADAKCLLVAMTKLSNTLPDLRPFLHGLADIVDKMGWEEQMSTVFDLLGTLDDLNEDFDISPITAAMSMLESSKLIAQDDINKVSWQSWQL